MNGNDPDNTSCSSGSNESSSTCDQVIGQLTEAVLKLTEIADDTGLTPADMVNEAFFLGFSLVVFCGLLAIPVITIIRVLRA